MSEHLIQHTDISIDSAKFRIPLENVEIVNRKMFMGKEMIHRGTGEVDPEIFDENKVEYSDNGITTKMAIQHQVTATQDVREFMVLQLNSKALMSAYQMGIRPETLPLLIRHINSLNVIKVDNAIMLESELTDVDLKKDAIFSDASMHPCLIDLEKNTIPSPKISRGYEIRWRKDNKGYWCNSRRTAHTLKHPFVKVYSKHCDFQYNPTSVPFYRTYLSDFKTDNGWRFEVTIKNKAHMKKLGITDNTLGGYFALPQSTLDGIMKDLLNRNLGERTPQVLKNKTIDRNKMFMYSMIYHLMNTGVHIEEIYNLSTRWIDAENKDQRKRLRSDVKKVYQDLLHEQDLKEKLNGTPQELSSEADEIEEIKSEYLGV